VKIATSGTGTIREVSRRVWWKPWTWWRKPLRVVEDYNLTSVDLISPDVYTQEIDCHSYVPPSDRPSIPAFIGMAEHGPTSAPIIIGPTIDKPRWWQFWRWHLIPRYRRECREAHAKFIEHFGQPTKNADYFSAAVMQYLNEPHDDDGNVCPRPFIRRVHEREE